MHLNKKEISIILFLLLIGLIRFYFFLPKIPDYDDAVGKQVSFIGNVVDDIDIRLNSQRIVVKPTNEDSNILVVASLDFDVFYGDKIKVKGILESPINFMTSSGKEFNYKSYLANKNIYFIVKNADIEIISNNNGNYFLHKLFKLKSLFIKNIVRVIGNPESDLALGLILGARGGFDTITKNEFITTGTIHIVALSGYNITIVAESIMKLFGIFLSVHISIVLGVLVVFLFILLTGASATSIRAGIMAFIMLFGRLTGRNYDAGRAIIIALLLMLAYDIRTINDISFQLSFLATFGVLFITPKIFPYLSFLTIRYNIRELTATTIAATISVLPLLIYKTGIFSLVSLPTNILILPLIPLTMFFSFLTGLFGFIFISLSIPFGFISELFLSYILKIIHTFASIPFASLNIKSFPISVTIFIYILILWWVFRE